MIISVKKDIFSSSNFEGDEYIINLNRKFEGYEKGDLVCYIKPWLSMPLVLEIAIRTNGDIIFRSWGFENRGNEYLHTDESVEMFTATAEQAETVSGLWSGRLRFEGLKIPVGGTVQDICPIDIGKEEQRTGKKIYLNG